MSAPGPFSSSTCRWPSDYLPSGVVQEVFVVSLAWHRDYNSSVCNISLQAPPAAGSKKTHVRRKDLKMNKTI